MARKTHRERRTAAVVAKELKEAEATIQRPSGTYATFVTLKVSEIGERPGLFQPRTFGLRDLDQHYVKKLQRRLRVEGELDPITVVKLGGTWTCVDGHHRLEAYRKQKEPREIKCLWFPGTAKDAVDEANRENKKIKLEMAQGDKFEQAWIRVILEWGSKRDIVAATGVSEGIVAHMRRVKKAYNEDTKAGQQLRARVGDLRRSSWGAARSAHLNIEPQEWSKKEAAAKLARILSSRLTNLLSRDPDVTAHALAIYDPELVKPLGDALSRYTPDLDDQD